MRGSPRSSFSASSTGRLTRLMFTTSGRLARKSSLLKIVCAMFGDRSPITWIVFPVFAPSPSTSGCTIFSSTAPPPCADGSQLTMPCGFIALNRSSVGLQNTTSPPRRNNSFLPRSASTTAGTYFCGTGLDFSPPTKIVGGANATASGTGTPAARAIGANAAAISAARFAPLSAPMTMCEASEGFEFDHPNPRILVP